MPIEFLVRAKGIEPSSKAWEAFVLPLYHARVQNAMIHTTHTKVNSIKQIALYYFWLALKSRFLIK